MLSSEQRFSRDQRVFITQYQQMFLSWLIRLTVVTDLKLSRTNYNEEYQKNANTVYETAFGQGDQLSRN